MWTTLRSAPSCPHIHTDDYDVDPINTISYKGEMHFKNSTFGVLTQGSTLLLPLIYRKIKKEQPFLASSEKTMVGRFIKSANICWVTLKLPVLILHSTAPQKSNPDCS